MLSSALPPPHICYEGRVSLSSDSPHPGCFPKNDGRNTCRGEVTERTIVTARNAGGRKASWIRISLPPCSAAISLAGPSHHTTVTVDDFRPTNGLSPVVTE